MGSGTIKHLCSECYALDKHGHCVSHKGERRENINFPIECEDYHPANMMLWYLVASSMNANLKKSEIAVLFILGILLFFTVITILMIFDTIPFFSVVWK